MMMNWVHVKIVGLTPGPSISREGNEAIKGNTFGQGGCGIA